jgi:hypothetical protein
MNKKRAEISQQLSDMMLRVEHGDRIIAAQQRIIAVLSEGGHDAKGAEKILDSYQTAQQARLSEMERLQKTLGKRVGR